MKQKETALRLLLNRGAFIDIQAMSQEDLRSVFILAEIMITASEEKLYMSAAIALGLIGAEGLPFLVHTMNTHKNAAVRLAAIQGLAQANNSRTVPALIDGLKDGHPNVRQKIARVLGQIGDARAINALIELMTHDKQHAPRESAIVALGKIGSARALTPLSTLVQQNEDATLVACAQQAIQEIEEQSGVKLPK